MKFNFTKKILRSERGFTLIELLVVISIIGLLSSIVLASLNSARNKGTSVAIRSNLRNAITEAEISYDTTDDYSTACASMAKMLSAVTSAGATTSCLSINDSSLSDVYLRYGASAIIGTSTPIQAYSASGTGVGTWDVQGVNTSGAFVDTDVFMTWDQANTACSTAGGRLPTIEELYTLSHASYIASANTSFVPPGFVAGGYYSSTTHPVDSTFSYIVFVNFGSISGQLKTSSAFVRCVR